jgi:hypothetical protein
MILSVWCCCVRLPVEFISNPSGGFPLLIKGLEKKRRKKKGVLDFNHRTTWLLNKKILLTGTPGYLMWCNPLFIATPNDWIGISMDSLFQKISGGDLCGGKMDHPSICWSNFPVFHYVHRKIGFKRE